MNSITAISDILQYYRKKESRWGYGFLLSGTRHFGYYPEGKETLTFPKAQEEMNHQLAMRLDLPEKSHVLDAGCGEGNTALHLASHHGYHIEGIDLLEESIHKAKELIRKKGLVQQIHVRAGDYVSHEWPDGTFDGVYTMETLVHQANYHDALLHFYDILKPGGTLVLFEYSMTPPKDLSQHQTMLWQLIIEKTAAYGLPHFHHGRFPDILSSCGYTDIAVENVTERILPMLKKFSQLAQIPYAIISFLGVKQRFVNTVCSVEAYEDIIHHDTWRYNIIKAKKPI